MKLSPGKHSLPGRKQVWRMFERHKAVGDVLGLTDEAGPHGATPLLQKVMASGRRIVAPRRPADVRERCLKLVGQLPADLRGLAEVSAYPVVVSRALEALAQRVNDRLDRPGA
jgi:nicotinate phosphoribosyltransferase